eukprot:jgi/Tetstr1/430909/TSEL_020665.t1
MGPLGVLQEGRDREGCHWDAETCAGAAASGSLEALKCCSERRSTAAPWSVSIIMGIQLFQPPGVHLAVLRAQLEPQGDHRGGHLDVLQCLAALGCPCHAAVLSTASRNGRLSVLRRATAADCCP